MSKMFKSKTLKLKSYETYLMFLEMNKMLTQTLIDILYDPLFKLYTVELIDSLKDIAISVEQSSESNIPEYAEYVRVLSKLINSYADKNEDESVIIKDDGNISISPENLDNYSKEIKELITKYDSLYLIRIIKASTF